MSTGVSGRVVDPNILWDYVCFVKNGQRYYKEPNGTIRSTDDFNPLLDALLDNNYELSIFLGAGAWPYDAPLLLEGAGTSWSRFPIIHGRGIGRSILQPLGASVHGIELTKTVTPDLRDFTLALDEDQIQYHGIYAKDDPTQTGYPEVGMYMGRLDNIRISGGKDHLSTVDWWAICLETSEFYHLSNIMTLDLPYRKNGVSLRQPDGTLSYAYHDMAWTGKNLINVEGEDVIGLEVANIASNKEINLCKLIGAFWIRLASGGGVGIHIDNFKRGIIRHVHTEDFPKAIHVENDSSNLEIGGGMAYSYVDAGGTFFDVDSGCYDIRFPNWYTAANAALTLINNAGGAAVAPIRIGASLQGAGAVTLTDSTGFVRFDRHLGMGSHEPWFIR